MKFPSTPFTPKASMMTPHVPTRDVTFEQSNKLNLIRSSRYEDGRSHAHSVIDELMNIMEDKKKHSDFGIKKVGELNQQLAHNLTNTSFEASSWKTRQMKKKNNQKKNTTFHDFCPTTPKQRSIMGKDEQIENLMAQNIRLREQLHKGDLNQIWKQLHELKKENQMLRKQTKGLLMRTQ